MNRQVLAAALVTLASSCGTIRNFQGAARVHGGYDGPAGEDVIFLELRNIEGLETGPYGLVFPSDWIDRPVAVDESGRLAPEPPVVPSLAPGTETHPVLELQDKGGEWGESTYVIPSEQLPLLVLEQEDIPVGGSTPEEVATRLGVGASAYVIVRPKNSSTIFDASIYGARLLPGGENSQDEGPVQWVFLGDVRLEDQRGWLAKSGDVVLRQAPNAILGTAGAVFLLGAMTSPLWIWFVI